MIKLSNGHEFNFMAPSGTFAYDGKGWFWEKTLIATGLINPKQFTVVTKTLTMEPRKGNLHWYKPWDCMRFIPDGVVNAVGLANPGISWWCQKIGPQVDSSILPIIGSIQGEPHEIRGMAIMLNPCGLVGLEINVSCPNADDGILEDPEKIITSCKTVAYNSRYPIILKLSVVHDIETIVPAVQDYVQAFSINSVPWNIAFPGQESPLVHLGGGGVSGKAAQKANWELVRRISQLTSVPIIAPDIWEYKDIHQAMMCGAKACSFGSLFLRHPLRPSQILDQYYFEGN
jgi:dihydroorotate dehydrogenase